MPKPAYRAFEALNKGGPLRAHVTKKSASAANLTVLPLLTAASDQLTILVAYHGTPGVVPPLQDLLVDLEITPPSPSHAAPLMTAFVGRVNATSANPQAAWVSMGSPDYPTPAQVGELQRASVVAEAAASVELAMSVPVDSSTGTLSLTGLRVEAYSLVVVRIPGLLASAGRG